MPRKTEKIRTTSDETWKNVDPKNKKLMEQFLKEKNTRTSDLTIKNYDSDLHIFFTWNLNDNDNKFFIDIKKLDFANFFSWCVDELKWGSARTNRMRSALSSFSQFIEKFFDDEYPNYRNLILKTIESMPKNLAREKTVLKDEQIDFLFKKLEEDGEYQILCWLALAIASGSRFAELLRFTTDIIDENNVAFDGIFLETTKPIKTKGRTKQGKMVKKYIIKDIFWNPYCKWLEERGVITDKNNKDHNFIFIRSNGDPALDSTIRIWISKIEEYLDVPFYPHALRHYYTTYLSKKNIPDNLIKELVGWSDLKMVELYCDLESKDREWGELKNLK